MVLSINVYIYAYMYIYIYTHLCIWKWLSLLRDGIELCWNFWKVNSLAMCSQMIFFFKHLMYGLLMFNQSQTQVKTSLRKGECSLTHCSLDWATVMVRILQQQIGHWKNKPNRQRPVGNCRKVMCSFYEFKYQVLKRFQTSVLFWGIRNADLVILFWQEAAAVW